MADNGWLRLEFADSVNIVIRHLPDPLVGKDLRVVLCLLNGFRVIGLTWRNRGVALPLEKLAPGVPTAREEPQAMYEHYRLQPGAVGTIDVLLFMGRKGCRRLSGHGIQSPLRNNSSATDCLYSNYQFHL